jgi:hypothetical protein
VHCLRLEKDPMNPIRIGQIGICHEHAAGKIATLRRLPDVYEIVGVVDDRNSPSAKYAGSDLAPYEGAALDDRSGAVPHSRASGRDGGNAERRSGAHGDALHGTQSGPAHGQPGGEVF